MVVRGVCIDVAASWRVNSNRKGSDGRVKETREEERRGGRENGYERKKRERKK